jgi:hypothetical protein
MALCTHLLSLPSLTSGSPVYIIGAGKLTDLTSWKMRMAGARDRADSAYNPSLHKTAMSQHYVCQRCISTNPKVCFLQKVKIVFILYVHALKNRRKH